jgi:hypothetical protein
MACMVALPDGTYLIVNGAHQGVAGFGLANDPNLSALLYDPFQPIGSRISILNNTIVARMYHSEATLLPDGRVLISGSDPQTNNPDGTVKYPEEYRIEVRNIVYLDSLLLTCFRSTSLRISLKDLLRPRLPSLLPTGRTGSSTLSMCIYSKERQLV